MHVQVKNTIRVNYIVINIKKVVFVNISILTKVAMIK